MYNVEKAGGYGVGILLRVDLFIPQDAENNGPGAELPRLSDRY